MIRGLVKRAANKFRIVPVAPNIAPQTPIPEAPIPPVLVVVEKPTLNSYLLSDIQSLDYLGPSELAVIDGFFSSLLDEDEKIATAKTLIGYFSKFPEKARLIAGSYCYLLEKSFSISTYIIFITGNYSMGKANLCPKAAKTLAEQWPNSLTSIMLARVLRECEGIEAERAVLEKAYHESNDRVVFYNLISNLIDSNKVDEANAAIERIRPDIEEEFADEIAIAKENQVTLENAIENQLYAPEGEGDIYSDKMCQDAWTSYYESFVTRREHVHGDRLILNHFLRWIQTVHNDLDVVLDFGTLCAQPLFEAALLFPQINFIGTDRQKLIMDLNNTAYPVSNLSFDHGDIFEVMKKTGALPGRKALVHIRTTCTLYPKFVEELYSAAKEFGFTHIYLVENAGLVRTRLQFMDFDSMEESALVTKHRLNIHNYRKQLEHAGYSVKNFARLSAPGLWRGEHPTNYLGSQYEIHGITV